MPRFVKSKWKFSDKDLWNLDMALTPIILAGLVSFINKIKDPKSSKGVPMSILKELFPDVDCNVSNYTEEQLQKGLEYFIVKLELMVFAFENKEPTVKDAGLIYDKKEMFKLVSGDIKLYRKLVEEHSKKVKLGFSYFAQHYSDLWI